MSTQNQVARASQQDESKRQARAHRILDAAAALILRWGYNKTTIDDVARRAGVAKGTIYLHWKTREDLFAALMRRERLALAEDFKLRLEQDPTGATLHGLIKHSALALMQRPLLKAELVRDLDVLGKLARSEYNSAANLLGQSVLRQVELGAQALEPDAKCDVMVLRHRPYSVAHVCARS